MEDQNFCLIQVRNFLKTWDVTHRVASAYYQRSNGRAEVAVKQAKRLLRSNVTESGSLDSNRFLRTMIQLRNTPDSNYKVSPAEFIYGRQLRDGFAFLSWTSFLILWCDVYVKKNGIKRRCTAYKICQKLRSYQSQS